MIEYICSFEEEYGFLVSASMKYGEELIRCKDCRYSDTYPASGEIHEMPLKCLGIRYGGVMPDWYCEHAERKEE